MYPDIINTLCLILVLNRILLNIIDILIIFIIITGVVTQTYGK